MKDLFDASAKTILIVDDDLLQSKLAQRFLENEDYNTTLASDGASCIELAITTRPDLILLDIYMPQMNGIEVARRLKKREQTIDIPIIFLTASTDDDMMKAAFEAGCSDYVRKPINRIELLVRIQSALIQNELAEKALREEKFSGVLEMAGAVCHEINQPMQIISGYSDLLLQDLTEDSDLYDNLHVIKIQIERLSELTKKIMKLQKYETKAYLNSTKIIDIDKASENSD